MIFSGAQIPRGGTFHADVCVVGSGPGGATVAMVAAEAGLRVVVLEAGDFIPSGAMTQREEEMIPRLYWDAGNRTTSDRRIRVHQGRGVGGSSLHNLNVTKRISEVLLDRWERVHGLGHLSVARWRELYDETEAMLSVSRISDDDVNAHNRIVASGLETLGWRHARLFHNRTGCVRSGFCELGCAYDAKNNALKVGIARAVRAGGEVFTETAATRVVIRSGRVEGVEALVRFDAHDGDGESHRIFVRADKVCLSASATSTRAILERSGLDARDDATRASLCIHPSVSVAGEFENDVRAWEGIPQSIECTQFLTDDVEANGVLESESEAASRIGTRTWILPAFLHPMGMATMLPGMGTEHRDIMLAYPRLCALAGMIHETSRGSVKSRGETGVRIDYRLNGTDRKELAFSIWAMAKILLAAGAKRVIIPYRAPRVMNRDASEAELLSLREIDPVDEGAPVTAVHPLASVPMSDDKKRGLVDSQGRCHRVAGLWIADGSLFPTATGVPPQLSIYALGLHVGRALVAEARSPSVIR